jgi:hypothetical protein
MKYSELQKTKAHHIIIIISFHNINQHCSFDGHLIIMALAKRCKNVDVIARGMELYTAFKTRQFRFIGERFWQIFDI